MCSNIKPFFGYIPRFIKLDNPSKQKTEFLVEKLLNLGFQVDKIKIDWLLMQNTSSCFYFNLYDNFSCFVSSTQDEDIQFQLDPKEIEVALSDYPYLFVNISTYLQKFKHKLPVALIVGNGIRDFEEVTSYQLLTEPQSLIVLKKERKTTK